MGYGVVLCAVPCFVTVGDKRVCVGSRSRYGTVHLLRATRQQLV
jgi:hypothetical protein